MTNVRMLAILDGAMNQNKGLCFAKLDLIDETELLPITHVDQDLISGKVSLYANIHCSEDEYHDEATSVGSLYFAIKNSTLVGDNPVVVERFGEIFDIDRIYCERISGMITIFSHKNTEQKGE